MLYKIYVEIISGLFTREKIKNYGIIFALSVLLVLYVRLLYMIAVVPNTGLQVIIFFLAGVIGLYLTYPLIMANVRMLPRYTIQFEWFDYWVPSFLYLPVYFAFLGYYLMWCVSVVAIVLIIFQVNSLVTYAIFQGLSVYIFILSIVVGLLWVMSRFSLVWTYILNGYTLLSALQISFRITRGYSAHIIWVYFIAYILPVLLFFLITTLRYILLNQTVLTGFGYSVLWFLVEGIFVFFVLLHFNIRSQVNGVVFQLLNNGTNKSKTYFPQKERIKILQKESLVSRVYLGKK